MIQTVPEAVLSEAHAKGFSPDEIVRVTAELRGQYRVIGEKGDQAAVVAGKLREVIDAGGAPWPTVGDWLALRPFESEGGARVMEHIFKRWSEVVRRAAGRATAEQTVAANVDTALIVCAAGRDVNVRRVERFVAIARNGHVDPVIILHKCDLMEDVDAEVARVAAAITGVKIHAVSSVTGAGMDLIAPYFSAGKTVVLLGTSGAGKSTLVNRLKGEETQLTGGMGVHGKGRHTTRARQMFDLPTGAVIIDTPGIREVGLMGAEDGVDQTFDEIEAFAAQCRFADCAHLAEPGCGVLAACKSGELDPNRVAAWKALRTEQAVSATRTAGQGALRRQGVSRRAVKAQRKAPSDRGRR